MSNDECVKIGFADGLRRLPGPQGEHNVALFEHGSLVVKLSQPRGPDLQLPHSRDEIYVVAQGTGEFVCGSARQTFSPHDHKDPSLSNAKESEPPAEIALYVSGSL